jgi:hypothetical protein
MAKSRRFIAGAFAVALTWLSSVAAPVATAFAGQRVVAAPVAWPPGSLPTTVTQVIPNPVAPLGSVYLSFECDAASTGQFIRVVDSGQFFGAPHLFPSEPLADAATRTVGAAIGVVESAPAGAVASIESYCFNGGPATPSPYVAYPASLVRTVTIGADQRVPWPAELLPLEVTITPTDAGPGSTVVVDGRCPNQPMQGAYLAIDPDANVRYPLVGLPDGRFRSSFVVPAGAAPGSMVGIEIACQEPPYNDIVGQPPLLLPYPASARRSIIITSDPPVVAAAPSPFRAAARPKTVRPWPAGLLPTSVRVIPPVVAEASLSSLEAVCTTAGTVGVMVVRGDKGTQLERVVPVTSDGVPPATVHMYIGLPYLYGQQDEQFTVEMYCKADPWIHNFPAVYPPYPSSLARLFPTTFTAAPEVDPAVLPTSIGPGLSSGPPGSVVRIDGQCPVPDLAQQFGEVTPVAANGLLAGTPSMRFAIGADGRFSVTIAVGLNASADTVIEFRATCGSSTDVSAGARYPERLTRRFTVIASLPSVL